MRLIALALVALGLLAIPADAAPDISGQWQGMLHLQKDLRIILKIAKAGSGYKAALYSIDESSGPVAEAPVAFDGKKIRIISGWCNYDATVSGDTLKGTLCIGNPRSFHLSLNFNRASGANIWTVPRPATDTSPHKARMVTVEKNVRLEVLDWGGKGQPLLFIHGLGGTAHEFDKFVPRLTEKYRVYAITRRGNGKSDKPPAVAANYGADRLRDDVLAVMAALKLDRPVLAGFSIGGLELSAIGTGHPDKVAGLIYLDAAYAYAYYAPGNLDPVNANLNMDANDLSERVNKLTRSNGSPKQAVQMIDELLKTLPQLESDLRTARAYYAGLPAAADTPLKTGPMTPSDAVYAGLVKFGPLKVPALAIYALPMKISAQAPAAFKADIARVNKSALDLAKRFAAANPRTRVVYVPGGDHDVFNSNPAQVQREMERFIDALQ